MRKLLFAALSIFLVTTTVPRMVRPQPAPPAFPPSQEEGKRGRDLLALWQELFDSLGAEQRNKVALPFDGDPRLDWHYIPRERHGLPLLEMGDDQRSLTWSFLAAGLGDEGVEKVHGVIELEGVLYEQSGYREMRNPDNYFLSVYGSPSASGAWGWRFEGHHLSLNFTLLNGRVVSATPAFFGANPGEVREGPKTGLRVLAAEEDLARRLLATFDGAQRDRVFVAATAPRDILTSASRRAEMGAPEGVAVGRMTSEQGRILMGLLGTYARRLHPDLAERQLIKIRQSGIERLHFAWAGSAERGEPHYYRIQGPTFVVEYDNTQNNANHIHSVWRDFDNDFGYDPLRTHLAHVHGLSVEGIPAGG